MTRLCTRLRNAARRKQRCPALQFEAADEIERLDEIADAADEALGLLQRLDPEHGITRQLAEALGKPPNAS